MKKSAEVREHLLQALAADLVGPFHASGDELLGLPPSRWYLTGFLVPDGTPPDAVERTDDEDELGAGDDLEEPAGGERPPEGDVRRRNRLPSSLGLSVYLPKETRHVEVTLEYADYVAEPEDAEDDDEAEDDAPKKRGAKKRCWRRIRRAPIVRAIELDAVALRDGVALDTTGLTLHGLLEEAAAPGLPEGARALSLFLVNRRPEGKRGRHDESFIFQVTLSMRMQDGLLARPNMRGQDGNDSDDQVLDLQFRGVCEYTVGHGVAAEPIFEGGIAIGARTTWLPRQAVARVVTNDQVTGVELDMEALAALDDGAAVEHALERLPDAYRAWIERQGQENVGPKRKAVRDAVLDRAQRARRRIAEGIALVASDATVRAVFCRANRAMALAARQRTPERYADGSAPRWRLFQLAFVLLNLPSVADERHADRETVELIFFPTGGGKTEAYLGVIACALLLRRLRGRARPDEGLGVAVLLRYTLRLLTLDQLGRAATLICALELQRRIDAKLLGTARFSVGLWVGKTATANTLKEVTRQITDYKNGTGPTPFPLTACPWCQTPIEPSCLTLEPSVKRPTEVRVGCKDFRCAFSTGKDTDGLPVLFVDEQIYRELPSFLVGTVDKFAMLPWRGEVGALFGQVRSRDGRRFFNALDGDKIAKGQVPLPDGLQPPSLIVQDELHLISGPLGTMAGLYETAIDRLCRRPFGGASATPKVIASTATVRRAARQIEMLFGRSDAQLFPPPGIDDAETFFATVVRDDGARLYAGVAAPGRALKVILLRVYTALLGAAEAEYRAAAEEGSAANANPADAYMTLVGYFNSLRELGGMRRLVEDEIRARLDTAKLRQPEDWQGPHPWVRARKIKELPVELTSRESTSEIARHKAALNRLHADDDHVDVLLASNMISVGVDIDRLGLMVVGGQPKATSEYIQASSRVGREAKRPGLVVTVYNVNKPRDRSHYERFGIYHQCFYRFVEATSLTPFAGPALDRGLAAVVVTLARYASSVMVPPAAAETLGEHRQLADAATEEIARRAARLATSDGDEVEQQIGKRTRSLLDGWQSIMKRSREETVRRCYSDYDLDSEGQPLLHRFLDSDNVNLTSEEEQFLAPTSLRDVEPSVHLWMSHRELKSDPPEPSDE